MTTDTRAAFIETIARGLCRLDMGGNDSPRLAEALERRWKEPAYIERAEVSFAAVLAHLDASGWQIVPVVATEEMLEAHVAATAPDMRFALELAQAEYQAALAAAPQFPGREG